MNQLLQDHNEYSSGFLQFAPEVIVEVTSSCDRKCRGCYAPNKVMDRTQAALDLSLHLSPAMLSNALRALSEPGAQIGKTIAIRGGEPTLNPMLPELLPTLQKVGEQLFLETHGRWLISAGIRNDGLDTLINSLRESGTTLKISYDRMHAMNPTILRQMTDAADSHGLPWCLAITTATVDELYELCKNIPWVPTSRIVYQPLAKEASELIKAKNSVISADGTTSKSLTHRFIENVVKESKPLLVVLISMLAALSGFSFDASAAGKASGAEKPLQNVQIGLASNFSSVSSSNSNPFGNYFLDGVTLALDESKDQLAAEGLFVTTQQFDYQLDSVKALEAARAAAASDVLAVIGYNWSSHALIAAPVHQASGLPMITPSATADRLAAMGKYIHLGAFDNKFMGTKMALIAKKKLGAKNAALVVAKDCAYCTDLAGSFRKSFESQGGTITEEVAVLENDTDFSSVATALKGTKADIFVVPNQELLSARIISALAKSGHKKPFIGGDGWGNVGEQFFALLENSDFTGYSLSHWHAELQDKDSLEFLRKYQSRFNKTPNDTSVLAYDSTKLLVKAIIIARKSAVSPLSLNREAVEKALGSIRSFRGVTGTFK